MSLSLSDVLAALRTEKVPAATITAVTAKLQALEADKKEDRATGPRAKRQFVVVALDPTGSLKAVPDFTALVVQMPDGIAPGEALTRIYASVYDFNATKAGRKTPVDTLGTAADTVRAKQWKAQQLKLCTREPVLVLRSDNNVPKQ